MTTKVHIDSILPLVKKPGRYIGGELNSVQPDYSQIDLSFALVFPDLYEIGMSHQGLQILYHLINRQPGLAAERAYAPDVDMEEQLRKNELPLFSLESRRPLADFDVIGFTLPYELCYTNILTVLDLAGIPLWTKDRGEDDPFIMGGGACSLNPEPVADFFDLIVLGDGEEVLLDIATTLRAAQEQGLSRAQTLDRCADISGVYVPSLFTPKYKDDRLVSIESLKQDYSSVTRRVVPELPPVEILSHPLVPLVKPIHDRLGVEIARGCTRSCRFCQAGMTYRPVRERSREQIMELAEQGVKNSGFDEVALLSLSTGDYSALPELLTELMDYFVDERVSVALPSMRVGTLTPEVIEQIKRVRKSGFTVAPEAGTDRLREVINKGITEEDLLAGCRDAFAAGWNVIKFYFMIGLPTETQEDLEAIIDLAMRARREAKGGRTQINVSVSTFVPKPHTPFQWHGQLSIAETKERIDFLKRKLPRKGFRLKWHEPYQSFLEGLFSRGDRRLAPLLEAAWQAGARLDGWSDHFLLERWQEAAEQLGLDLDAYLQSRGQEEVLPWDHLHCGVSRDFLLEEWQKALDQVYTPDCRTKGCQQCGLCDFKSIKPLIQNKKDAATITTAGTEKNETGRQDSNSWKRTEQGQQTIFRYRVRYSRLGDGRFLGHLEVLQLVFRGLQRTGLPLLFSQGFNPSPKVSFSPALPVGVESHIEYFDIDLAAPLSNFQETAVLLNTNLPDFLDVQEIEAIRKKPPVDQIISYQCTLPESVDMEQLAQQGTDFLAADHFVIERIRKQKKRELDLRPLVKRLEMAPENDNLLLLDLFHPHGSAGTSSREILEKVLGLSEEQSQLVRIVKYKAQECEE